MKLSRLYDEPQLRAALEAAEKSDRERLSRLTNQQRAVMALIVEGSLNKQAASALGLSQRTIENHRLEIMSRTGCKTLPQLCRLFMRTSGHMEISND